MVPRPAAWPSPTPTSGNPMSNPFQSWFISINQKYQKNTWGTPTKPDCIHCHPFPAGTMLTMESKSFGSRSVKRVNGPQKPPMRRSTPRLPRCPVSIEVHQSHVMPPTQAEEDPEYTMGGVKFEALDNMNQRDQKEKALKLADPKHDRYAQAPRTCSSDTYGLIQSKAVAYAFWY